MTPDRTIRPGIPRRAARGLAAAIAAVCAVGAAQADERYLGVFVGSRHIGSDLYNDVNPGLTFGLRRPLGARGVELHGEAGVFLNSYEEVSPIALAGVSAPVARLGQGELRLGASAGVAYYGELAEAFEREGRFLPEVGGFVPIGVLTAAWRAGRVETRINVLPYGDDVDGVVNLSFAVSF